MRVNLHAIAAGMLGLLTVTALHADPRSETLIQSMDKDSDGKVSRSEWTGPPRLFRMLDTDQDGFLTLTELDQAHAQVPADQSLIAHLKAERAEKAGSAAAAASTDAGPGNQVPPFQLKGPHKRAFASGKAGKEEMRAAGLDESGLLPIYPEDLRCYKIDHVFGEKWKGPADTLHSGADIPAPHAEPIVAMADGVLIYKSDGQEGGRQSRGNTVVLQHSPTDTGFPFWLYTLYSHFDKMPEAAIGTRFQMGQYLGPNGRSGVPGARREPHLHLTVYLAKSPFFSVMNNVIVPDDGEFVDPVALFRGKLPMTTATMKLLTGDDRRVTVSYAAKDGAVFPKGSRLIWPFRCS